jgi:hypothetical protein
MATTAPPTSLRATVWSPARIYLVVSGLMLVGAAVAGFALTTSFPGSAEGVRAADNPHIYGILETNGWHNLASLVSGSLSLTFALRPEWARAGALFKGSMYTVVTASIAIWGPEVFLLASNTADQVVHGSLAATGLATGLATRRART